MAKTPKKSTAQEGATPNGRAFVIKQIFIKRSALDIKIAPFELTSEWQPDASMDLDVEAKAIENNHFVVDLKTVIDVKNDGKEIFKIETIQAGIFEIAGYTETQVDQLKNSFCPNVLFPYARQIVSQLTSQAGFPPLIMAPIDFDGRYQQLLQKEA